MKEIILGMIIGSLFAMILIVKYEHKQTKTVLLNEINVRRTLDSLHNECFKEVIINFKKTTNQTTVNK